MQLHLSRLSLRAVWCAVLVSALVHALPARAQEPPVQDTLPNEPQVFDSSIRGSSGAVIPGPKFRVVPMKGLSRPYALVFLPDGDMLVTERAGKLRWIHKGVLDPEPIAGIPPVVDRSLRGLNDLALHPNFSQNHLLYFTYYKPVPESAEESIATLARARWDGGHTLSDVKDIFSAGVRVGGPSAARMVFGRDNKLYLAIGIPIPNRSRNMALATPKDAQDPSSYYGKVLRLNDDGTAPSDNPFLGKPGYKPEIYALGIRNAMAIVVHPTTGELWETENGPQGGDELNIIKPGKNYGWPIISYGRSYGGELTGDSGPVSDQPFNEGMEQPLLFWSPSIALSGMAFYTGDKFPQWKGNIFVGGLVGEQMQRIMLNDKGLPIRRAPMLTELHQRIREVRQGPDGLLYVLTDERAGALLRIEPVQ